MKEQINKISAAFFVSRWIEYEQMLHMKIKTA